MSTNSTIITYLFIMLSRESSPMRTTGDTIQFRGLFFEVDKRPVLLSRLKGDPQLILLHQTAMSPGTPADRKRSLPWSGYQSSLQIPRVS